MSIYCCCIVCQKVFSIKGIFVHYERSHGTEEQRSKYSSGHNGHYNDENYRNKMRETKQHLKKVEMVIPIESICPHCGVTFLNITKRIYCSRRCAAKSSKVTWTNEMRENASIISKLHWENEEYRNKLISNVNNSRYFTSKNERIIRQHFINYYPFDNWTFGGLIKFDNSLISRDLYSNTLKVCIEYDGIWHFKDIHGQLQDKQKKDNALKKWCLQKGYRLIRIDEDIYNMNPTYYLNHLVNLVYNDNTPIIEIGIRY